MSDLTPAEELRSAARLMRERAAEAEDCVGDTGKPWCPDWTYTAIRHVQRNCDIECPEHPDFGDDCITFGRYAGYHIASWHPAVALAVADWLEAAAKKADEMADEGVFVLPPNHALKIARAYLGSTDA